MGAQHTGKGGHEARWGLTTRCQASDPIAGEPVNSMHGTFPRWRIRSGRFGPQSEYERQFYEQSTRRMTSRSGSIHLKKWDLAIVVQMIGCDRNLPPLQ